MLTFLDSFQQPTQAQAELFWQQGYRGWAFNVWGWYPDGNAADIWAVSTAQMLRAIGFRLLPIGVPRLDMSGDPAANAAAAIHAASAYGIEGLIGCDTENVSENNDRLHPYLDRWHATVAALGDIDVVYKGAHYLPAGAASWTAAWFDNPPTWLPQRSAWQWSGGHVINGVDVDRNVADVDFPLFPLQGPSPQPPPMPPVTPPESEHIVAVVAASRTGSSNAYWVLTSAGSVYSYNGAVYYGACDGLALPGPAAGHDNMVPGDTAVALVPSASGNGYLITTAQGHGYNFGDFPLFKGPVAV